MCRFRTTGHPLSSDALQRNSVPPAVTARVARVQRKTVAILASGQVLGGLGTGVTLSLGALLITEVSGSSAWSGMAATFGTLGAALLAIPLARLAEARGRRVSLSTGALLAVAGSVVIVAAAVVAMLWMILLGVLILGAAQALNLQSRFAATDLATASTRGRDLSFVVWSTTIGAVIGPNLFDPGEWIGQLLGLPELTGGFVIAAAAQALGAVVYFVGLRPEPLKLRLAIAAETMPPASTVGTAPSGFQVLHTNSAALRAVAAVALSHAVMVALMSMTPVHLAGHGASLTLVGFTISLHVAGMYALSPVFGILTDRVGARATVLLGQALFIASLLLSFFASSSATAVTVSLVLLGLGWSASTVAGSALVSAAVPVEQRTRLQGVSDMTMNLVGALGGAIAGPVLTAIGFGGLAGCLLVLVAAIVITQALRRTPAPI